LLEDLSTFHCCRRYYIAIPEVSATEKVSAEEVKIISERATVIEYMSISSHVSLSKVCSLRGDKHTTKIIVHNKLI
jgi:carbonic anhydrase/acetyltransferase-like protein (isoleucine patch superfamily)